MALFDFMNRRSPAPAAVELPIFPLHSVLFPGGALSLKVFEQRYVDLMTACMKEQQPFGVCLIAEGSEVGAPALPHAVGVAAHIGDWDMVQLGVLNIKALGTQRFRILRYEPDAHGVIRADVAMLQDAHVDIPAALQDIIPLLRAIAVDAGEQRVLPPLRFDDADWVGYRFAELLPISPLARYKLLELDDPLSRLEIIRKFLLQRGLVG